MRSSATFWKLYVSFIVLRLTKTSLTLINRTRLTPVAGPTFETKIESFFLESFFLERNSCPSPDFFWSSITARELCSHQCLWSGFIFPELEHLYKNVFTASFPKRSVRNVGCSFVSKKRTRSGSNVSSRLGKDQLSIHFTSLLDYLKSSKHYCPRNLEMGRNSSPEKSSPEKSSRFLSQKLVLRPALGILEITSAKRCPQVWPCFGRSLFSTACRRIAWPNRLYCAGIAYPAWNFAASRRKSAKGAHQHIF